MPATDLNDALLAPVSAESPCGDDLEYDAAFIALESAAQRKPEQQFGDTLIPAVEPDWAAVQEQAAALLLRSKDVRPAVLLLRALTRLQGVRGFCQGMQLLAALLERYWDGIYPALDADDGNDATMRLNALAPLWDDALVVRDLYEAAIGEARGIGTIRVRDVAIARNALDSAQSSHSLAQIQGGLQEILRTDGAAAQAMLAVAEQVLRLQQAMAQHTGRGDAVDFARLRAIGKLLAQAVGDTLGPLDAAAGSGAADSAANAAPGTAAPAAAGAPPGAISSRQQALLLLDQVIQFLQQTEPGNPAPLLIQRAKKLIGVSFLEIIHDLAPDAMSTIEQVTGARSAAD